MKRLSALAFVLALASTLITGRVAKSDVLGGIWPLINDAIKQIAPLLTKAQIELITTQLAKMDDPSLYLLKAAPDVCNKANLIKIDCGGLSSADVKPLVEFTLDHRRADELSQVAKRSAEMANDNFHLSIASLGLSALSFGVAFWGAVIKKREFDAARVKDKAVLANLLASDPIPAPLDEDKAG